MITRKRTKQKIDESEKGMKKKMTDDLPKGRRTRKRRKLGEEEEQEE